MRNGLVESPIGRLRDVDTYALRMNDRAARLGRSGARRGLQHGHSDLNSGGGALLSPSAGVKPT
jgi:hypothetical protein